MHVAKIRLRKPPRIGLFQCDDIALQRDDTCVVQSERGQEWGQCVLPPEPAVDLTHLEKDFRVLRLANHGDINNLDIIESEEKKARHVFLSHVAKHKLDMKLVEVEYTFDRRKVVFFFTAEDRIDFRELVRELAHELRTRIELRHIQVRDEARMLGGLGCCGRPLCCASWMTEFKPISMRMAKRQDLSLNPTKISGQCGRLLCCLSHENDQYENKPRKKRKPASQNDCGKDCPDKKAADMNNAKKVASAEPEQNNRPAENAQSDRQASGQRSSGGRKRGGRRRKRGGGGGGGGGQKPQGGESKS
jgi:cell fate regulator YaaT (PSP1 superfamily)